jgi:hypothetical protein
MKTKLAALFIKGDMPSPSGNLYSQVGNQYKGRVFLTDAILNL